MTTTIVLGRQKTEDLKSITFSSILTSSLLVSDKIYLSPKDFKFLELVSKEYSGGLDLIFAYDNPENRGEGTLFIGYWNDGVV